VIQGEIDTLIGFVHTKDLFALYQHQPEGDLRTVLREVLLVPDTIRSDQLLRQMQLKRQHMAVLVDEYGGTVGLVTMENILEELVGQIQDEFDQEKALLVRIDENTWDLDGSLPLHELSELVGQNLAAEGIATVSGWVTQQLGGFPKVGDVITLGSFDLRVEEAEAMRVARLRLTRIPGREPEAIA
jgi:CBS domain containing-hemolysin-like protein